MVQNLFIVWLKYNLKTKSGILVVFSLSFKFLGCVGFSVRMKYIWTSEFDIWICGKNEE